MLREDAERELIATAVVEVRPFRDANELLLVQQLVIGRPYR